MGDLQAAALADAPDLAPGDAVLVDWDEARYHADRDHVSNSWLSVLLKEGPAAYRAKRDGVIPQSFSPAMTFGTHAHLAVLEPDRFSECLFEPQPHRPASANGRAKKGSPEKEAYRDWKVELETWELLRLGTPDAIVLDEDELDRVNACAASVRSHPSANELLESAIGTEQTILRCDLETGVLLRHRLDFLTRPRPDVIVVGDLKTTSDPSPEPFGKSVYRYGYHRQAAMYSDAIQEMYPGAAVHFVIIAVHSVAPFEVGVYEVEANELEQGRREYRRALRDLARRRADNDWLAPWQRGINTIEMSRWAFDEDLRP